MIFEESEWERTAKIIVVEGKGRMSGDGRKMKRLVIAMEVGVAISSRTRTFMLLTKAGISMGLGVSGR